MSEKIFSLLIQENTPTPDKPQEIKSLLVNEEAMKYIEQQSQEIESFKEENKKLNEENNDLYYYLDENKRLNNIINELEKWLEKEKDKKEEIAVAQGLFIDKDLSERLDHQIGTIDYILDKLQELKGSDKE